LGIGDYRPTTGPGARGLLASPPEIAIMAGERVSMTTSWKLVGTYFEACNCSIPCPFIFKSPPTDGACTVMIRWHIDSGHHGETSLDGLNVVHMVHVPGLMVDGGWRLARYIDSRGSEAQTGALSNIFSGRAGGPPALSVDLIDEVLGERLTPIDYRSEGQSMSLAMARIATMEMTDIEGKEEGPVTIVNSPMGVISRAAKIVSRSSVLRYRDFDMTWEISDRNGYHTSFDYAGP
tara:strand:+ start:8404 stop:9108 length:705 start_codon:yes stop_codon:yes gene_type:complete